MKDFVAERWTANQSNFYVDFRMATSPDGLYGSNRLWAKKAWIELSYFDEDCMDLKGIEAKKLRHGYGGEALDWLLGLCVNHGVSVVLDVDPFVERGLMVNGERYPLSDPRKLEAYYRRRGFEDFDRQIPGHGEEMPRSLIYRA